MTVRNGEKFPDHPRRDRVISLRLRRNSGVRNSQ
jgi:hypothetical protein